MNYLGVYHSNYPRPTVGVCDAPCVSKGRMMLCAPEIASEGRQIAMAYGRIRNRDALLRRLNADDSISNSQLVLLAYRKWGTGYPKWIEGPAMTCAMDTSSDTMVLSRDRMGESAVFYSLGEDGRTVFSDHPDSLLKSASANPIVDREGMCELFGLGPARTPGRTPLRDIRTLPPGCVLIGEDGKTEIRAYYALPVREHRENEADTIRHTRELLDQAVVEVLPLKPGAMLSGGLDSTALTALMCEKMGEVQTFSVDYRDNDEDFRPNAFRPERDAPYITMAVEALKTNHHMFILEQASLADALDKAVSVRGFPGMADIDTSLMLFAGQIAKFNHNVVSGECGDEVFGGYPWFRSAVPMTENAFPWSGSVDLRESILRPEIQKKLDLRDYVRQAVRDSEQRTHIEGDDSESRLRRMQLMCFEFFMANLQERATRMCGYQGVKVLTPLCDDRLVEYVFNVPWKLKFKGGIEKGLFRAAVRDLLPPELNRRKKSPYPKTCSPIYTEIIRGLTTAMLTDREAPILEWIDVERVRSIAQSVLDPVETPWYGQLMAGPQMLAYLWQVNVWMRDRNIMVRL